VGRHGGERRQELTCRRDTGVYVSYAGGAVFAGSSTGRVYAVSAATGKQIWAGVAGSVIRGPDEQNADVLVGMAVGDGLLVVPAGNALAADAYSRKSCGRKSTTDTLAR
jgi:outer membrane protein assembly factor BamB